jgi:hypothetical protein
VFEVKIKSHIQKKIKIKIDRILSVRVSNKRLIPYIKTNEKKNKKKKKKQKKKKKERNLFVRLYKN